MHTSWPNKQKKFQDDFASELLRNTVDIKNKKEACCHQELSLFKIMHALTRQQRNCLQTSDGSCSTTRPTKMKVWQGKQWFNTNEDLKISVIVGEHRKRITTKVYKANAPLR